METSKIIMLILILAGFITMMYLFKNKLDTTCTEGDIYDQKLGKCIIDCSLTPNTHYDSDKDMCVSNCINGQIICGDKCMNNNQKCLHGTDGKDYICNSNEDICGSNCFNNSIKKCIKGQLYNNDKVCDPNIPLTCGDNQQCSHSKTECKTCPDDRQLCGVNDTCCDKGQFCEEDGTCKSCDPKTQSVCGSTCCTIGQKCSSTGKCVTCTTDLCGEECCKDGKECANGVCCDPDHIYTDSNGKKACCINKTCGGICCDSTQSCQNDKCMIECGSGIFCDPEKTVCMNTKDPKTPFYCATIGCEWDQLDYIPVDMPISSTQSQKVCVDNTNGKLYITRQSDKNLSRTVHTQQSVKTKAPCGDEDCKGRLIEDGIQHIIHDGIGCSGDFNCNAMLPESLTNCPFKYNDGKPDTKRCCMTKDGKYTGQVCNDGEYCDENGNCGNYTDKCRSLMPRCKQCNGDPENLKCLQADIGFDTEKCVTGTGCPMIEDTFYWTPYIGTSVHYNNDQDNNSCVPGTNAWIDMTEPTGKWKMNYCFADDFRNIKGFENTDMTGLDSTKLSVSSVSLDNPNTDDKITYYLPLSSDSPGYIDNFVKNTPGGPFINTASYKFPRSGEHVPQLSERTFHGHGPRDQKL